MLALCALSLAPARAATDCAGPHAWSTLDSLPNEIDLAIVIEDAPAHLNAPQGRALTRAIADSGLFDETIDAWRAVARAMGLDPDEVPARLLGRRVTVLLDAVPRPPAARWPATQLPDVRWAVITEVDRDTERLVRERLDAAPRQARPNATVLSVERGKFRLAVVRGPDANSPRLVFTPASSGDMLATAINAANPGPVRAARAPVAAGLDPGEIVGFARLNAFENLPGDTTLAWSAQRVPSGWHADLALDGCEPGTPNASIAEHVFLALANDAAAAVLIKDSAEAFDQLQQALGVTPFPKQGPLAKADPVVTGPLMAMVFALPIHADEHDTALPGRIAVQFLATLAPEDPHARFDQLVSTYLVPFQNTQRLPGQPASTGMTGSPFNGRFPDALRRQPVSVSSNTLASLVGSEGEVAWRYAQGPAGPMGVLTCAPRSAPHATTAPALTTTAAARLTAEPPDKPTPSLRLGLLLRPSDLVQALAPPGKTAPQPAAALRRIREVRLLLHEPADPASPRAQGEFLLLTDPERWGDLGTRRKP